MASFSFLATCPSRSVTSPFVRALVTLAYFARSILGGCSAGETVQAQREGELAWITAKVNERVPGLHISFSWLDDMSNATLPPTLVRDLHGEPCARAVLGFFGRVASPHGRYTEHGSFADTIEIASPTIREHVINANPNFVFDIVAQTWDVPLIGVIRQALHPLESEAVKQPASLDSVHSFAEAMRLSARLKRRAEARLGRRYDLAILMRYDIFFRQPLPLFNMVPTDKLWSGHWCSIHAQDLSVREVRLVGDNESLGHDDPTWDPVYRLFSRHFRLFFPSQFHGRGLHDYWFAASSENIDRFAEWGESIDTAQARFGTLSQEVPIHSGHFYTYIHAASLGLQFAFTATSYVDYTLVRWRNCNYMVGEKVLADDMVCTHSDPLSWEKRCETWITLTPAHQSYGLHRCPIAGHVATLAPGSRGCWRL